MSKAAERAVLGSVLTYPDNIMEVRDRLTPDHFRYDPHRTIYEAMVQLADDRRVPDYLALTETLGEKVSALEVSTLLEGDTNPWYVGHYIDTLLTSTRRKQATDTLAHALHELQGGEDVDAYAVLASALRAYTEDTATGGPRSLADLAGQLRDRLEQQRAGTWVEPVTPTGFPTLDKALGGGFRPGELIVLAGRPGMAKTAMALALATHAARHAPALFYSLEMSAVSLAERAVADAAGYAMEVVRGKYITTAQYERMSEVVNRLGKLPVYIDDTSAITTEQATVRTQRFTVEHGGCSLVLTDYLEIMGDRDRDEVRRVGSISKGMKHLARVVDVPTVLLAQLNRGVEDRHPPIPSLSDIRMSGAVEADADVVLMLYRQDYYEAQGGKLQSAEIDPAKRGTCDVLIQKQRNGATTTVTLGFDPVTMTFRDPTEARR